MSRIRERDLMVPALRAAADAGGAIKTKDLIGVLENYFQPDGQDAEILADRHDSYFSQKVRNLISHRDVGTSMFTHGYAIYDADGEAMTITDKGFMLLGQSA